MEISVKKYSDEIFFHKVAFIAESNLRFASRFLRRKSVCGMEITMVGLTSVLFGEVIYEAVKFVIMLCLLAGGVFIGSRLRKKSDAKKAAKAAQNEIKENIQE